MENCFLVCRFHGLYRLELRVGCAIENHDGLLFQQSAFVSFNKSVYKTTFFKVEAFDGILRASNCHLLGFGSHKQ